MKWVCGCEPLSLVGFNCRTRCAAAHCATPFRLTDLLLTHIETVTLPVEVQRVLVTFRTCASQSHRRVDCFDVGARFVPTYPSEMNPTERSAENEQTPKPFTLRERPRRLEPWLKPSPQL